MGRKRFDLRVAVGEKGQPRSSIWAFWSSRSEVYAAHRSMGGIEKFSFHTPDLCRHAFTKESGLPRGHGNRLMQSWRRGSTPSEGTKQIVSVLRVGISTDHLSTALEDSPPKNTVWIPPAPVGGSTILDLGFTNEKEVAIRRALESEQPSLAHKLIAFHELPNGESFFVKTWHSERAQKVFRVLAAPHDPRDLLILPVDPQSTGRPVRFTLLSNPKDGDVMWAWEMGGYWHSPLTDEQWQEMCEPFECDD